MSLNGRLFDNELAQIPFAPHFRLRADAVDSLVRMNAAYLVRFGVNISITDAYRTYAEQVVLKIRKPRLATTPGTSNHGWGVALDLGGGIESDGTIQHRWMTDNAGSFGWTNPMWAVDYNPSNGAHEPWHYEHSAILDRHAAPIVVTVPTQEKDMPLNAQDLQSINDVVYRLLKAQEIQNLISARVAEQLAAVDFGKIDRDAVLAILREKETTDIIRAASH